MAAHNLTALYLCPHFFPGVPFHFTWPQNESVNHLLVPVCTSYFPPTGLCSCVCLLLSLIGCQHSDLLGSTFSIMLSLNTLLTLRVYSNAPCLHLFKQAVCFLFATWFCFFFFYTSLSRPDYQDGDNMAYGEIPTLYLEPVWRGACYFTF